MRRSSAAHAAGDDAGDARNRGRGWSGTAPACCRSARAPPAPGRSCRSSEISETTAVALSSSMALLPKVGSMTSSACGRMTWRMPCQRLRLSAVQASYCSRADRLDGAAHHLRAIGADIEAKRQHAGLQRRQRDADEAAARNRPRTAARRSRCRGRTRYRRWRAPAPAKKRDSRPSPARKAMTSASAEPISVSSMVTSAPCKDQAEIAGPLGHQHFDVGRFFSARRLPAADEAPLRR